MEVIPEALQKIARLTGRRKLIFRLAPGNLWCTAFQRRFKGELLAVKVNRLWNFESVTKNKRCCKKRHGHNFEFSDLSLNQRLGNPLFSALIQRRLWKLKIVAVSFFCNAAFCCWKKLKNDWTLTANNSPLKSRTPKKYHIFGKLWTCSFTWWYPGYGIVFENFE